MDERTVYTTSQAADACNVTQRDVSRWCDSGRLHSYRVPGTASRRIPRESLIKFLRSNGMSLDALDVTDAELSK